MYTRYQTLKAVSSIRYGRGRYTEEPEDHPEELKATRGS